MTVGEGEDLVVDHVYWLGAGRGSDDQRRSSLTVPRGRASLKFVSGGGPNSPISSGHAAAAHHGLPCPVCLASSPPAVSWRVLHELVDAAQSLGVTAVRHRAAE